MITIAKVKQAADEFVKVLRYGRNDIKTADYVAPHGIESKPVKGDVAVHAQTSSDSLTLCLGYLKDAKSVKPGETLIYSTNADGVRQIEFYFKNDGTAELGGSDNNLTRFQELENGFNQLKSDFNSFVTNKYNVHTHVAPSGTTGTPSVVGTSSSATIADAKITYLFVK